MRVLRCAIWRAVAALTYLTIALAAVPRLRAQDKTYFITGINMGVTGSITTDGGARQPVGKRHLGMEFDRNYLAE